MLEQHPPLVALALAGLTLALIGVLWLFGGRLRALGTSLRYRCKQALVRFVMGGSHPNTSRLLAAVVVGSGLVAGVGFLGLLVNEAETSTSSAPIVTTLLSLATNPWVWALAIVLLFRSLLFFGDRLLSRIAAEKSGYNYQTVRRLAEEARQPDLDSCERVLVQTGDSAQQIARWLLDAFDGNGHDAPTFNPPGADGESDETVGETDVLEVPDRAEPIDVDPPTDETDADDEPDFWTQLRLFRLELGSAVDLHGVLWRFLAPAGFAFVGILLWLRIWIQLWMIPVVIAASVFVGAVYYWAVDLRHRRRLKALRSQEEPTRWTDLAILTKTVEVPETTMYYGFFDGNVYASEDKHELARTLADRAIDRLEGREPAPAIEEKNAYLLQRYLPMLEAWREEHEKVAIMDQLIETVHDAPEGMIPRDLLVEQVVEYDRRYIAWGLLFVGRGRDPDLVREVYRDLVDAHAIVETPITLTNTEDGTEREIVAASLGDESLPPNVAQLRGEFSSLFGKQAFNTRYSAPTIDDDPTPAPFVRPETHD
ncbi:hypothetical protein [Halopiger xanaduensis]|uniref:Uncharacterized protein n=1 Tax=Halopiger xanaduensis (strain DSM 18323 / JCM 14033 / SH-6) TaxID=797210 RepID=F8DET8_HALXS|nr:hypothetical protein [Halopiger xanaduensis]AEH39528.1 hypothetical protein Halxa_0288 [Halopiger xanaduensis SH-6]